MGYNYGKVIGSDEGIKLGFTDVNVIDTKLVNVGGITPGVDIGLYIRYLH